MEFKRQKIGLFLSSHRRLEPVPVLSQEVRIYLYSAKEVKTYPYNPVTGI